MSRDCSASVVVWSGGVGIHCITGCSNLLAVTSSAGGSAHLSKDLLPDTALSTSVLVNSVRWKMWSHCGSQKHFLTQTLLTSSVEVLKCALLISLCWLCSTFPNYTEKCQKYIFVRFLLRTSLLLEVLCKWEMDKVITIIHSPETSVSSRTAARYQMPCLEPEAH